MIQIFSLLLILGSTSCQQWMNPSGRHEWESRVPAVSSFHPSLLSLRSSEEQPMKSPLAASSEFLLPSSSSSSEMVIEAEPITVNHRIMKKRGMLLQRRPSPVPSAEKWWLETMRNQRNNEDMIRFTPYEYPQFPSSFAAGLEGPEFIPMPLKYNHKKQAGANKKKLLPKKVQKVLEAEEMEKVSDNPPEFLPSEVETLEVRLPKKKVQKKIHGNKRKSMKKITSSTTPSSGSEVEAAPAVYNMQSDRLESAVIKESNTDESDPKPLIPDRMLGNDMMFHHNRLEETSRSAAGGNAVDDPNDDFELIQ